MDTERVGINGNMGGSRTKTIGAGEDPFYSEANMAELMRRIADIEAGRNLAQHDLIEVDDD
ncbi:MAG: hypothetical protein LBD16_06815 [Oscillospiraceae bacterium]|jgi:DNA-damage-inducible protein J|nr:hypothetical protein [Oscillospiraceae bacterium]